MEMNRPLRNVRLECETPERQVAFQARPLQPVGHPAGIALGKTLKLGEVGGQALEGQPSSFRNSLERQIENQGLTFFCGVPGAAPPFGSGPFALKRYRFLPVVKLGHFWPLTVGELQTLAGVKLRRFEELKVLIV